MNNNHSSRNTPLYGKGMEEIKTGDAMIRMFQNKSLMKKIIDLYPKKHLERKWLVWGTKNSSTFRKSYEDLGLHWPLETDYTKKQGTQYFHRKYIAKVIRLNVLFSLSDAEERLQLMDEIKEHESMGLGI